MNRDNIAKMYEKANGWSPASSENTMNDLERFANLVAAYEREVCATMADLVAREIDDTHGTATYIAAAIRARGNHA